MAQQEMLASFSQPVQERRIMAAWERFLESGEVADVVMSLDNVIAIAAVAERFEAPHNYALLMFGLAVSIPLIMAGAALVMALLERFPIVVWAGAALLGWIAGEIIAKDPLFTANLDEATAHTVEIIGATLGALFVIAAGMLRRRWLRRSAPDQV